MKSYGLLFFILVFSQLGVAKTTVRTLPSVEIGNSKNITLEMVISSEGLPKELLKILNRVRLGNVPKVGERRVFSGTAIAMAFRKNLSKEQLNTYKLVIPNQVVVRVKDRRLTERNVKKELLSIWQSQCSTCSYKIKYLSLPKIKNIKTVEHWSLDTGRDTPRGSFNLAIHIKQIDKPTQQYWVAGQVRTFKKALVVKEYMTRGERFTKENTEYKSKDITFSYDSLVNIEDVVGRKSKQSLRVGSIIWQNSIVREKAINRGEIIKVLITSDSFEVSTFGKAKSDGFIGDRVQVETVGANKLVTGSVTKKGEVRVE